MPIASESSRTTIRLARVAWNWPREPNRALDGTTCKSARMHNELLTFMLTSLPDHLIHAANADLFAQLLIGSLPSWAGLVGAARKALEPLSGNPYL